MTKSESDLLSLLREARPWVGMSAIIAPVEKATMVEDKTNELAKRIDETLKRYEDA